MRALVDGDILLYRVGYTTQVETEAIAQYRMDELIQRILDTVQATEHTIYLSCGRKDSFRAKLNPEYKAHRTQEKPVHYTFLRNYLTDKWNAVTAVEEEADDLIGINLKGEDTIACTIDKDILHGLEGNKYNFVKEEMFYTPAEDATLFFYKQLLMGDKADNIFGLKGIGPAKASNALNELLYESEEVLFDKVFSMYQDAFPEKEKQEIYDLILLSGQQLKIRSYEGELWQLPRRKNGQRVDEERL